MKRLLLAVTFLLFALLSYLYTFQIFLIMKFGVVVFPGSNCDRDMQDALQQDLNQEVIMLWHKDKDISMFSTEDCLVTEDVVLNGEIITEIRKRFH